MPDECIGAKMINFKSSRNKEKCLKCCRILFSQSYCRILSQGISLFDFWSADKDQRQTENDSKISELRNAQVYLNSHKIPIGSPRLSIYTSWPINMVFFSCYSKNHLENNNPVVIFKSFTKTTHLLRSSIVPVRLAEEMKHI